jgi:pilus assembly protein CpaE
MTAVVFISPASHFEPRFDAVLGPSGVSRRRWHEECLRVDPTKVVDAFGQPDVEVVCLGPDLPPEAALGLAEAFDRERPDLCVVVLAEPTAALWEGALRAGVRDVISPRADDQTLAGALQRARVADRRRATLALAATPPAAAVSRVIAVLSPKVAPQDDRGHQPGRRSRRRHQDESGWSISISSSATWRPRSGSVPSRAWPT